MPVLPHRTESKRGPCAAWFSSGRTDIPEIHPEIPHGGISKKLNVLVIPYSGFLGVGCSTADVGLTVLLTPKDVSAIRHDEANKYSAVFLAELPNGLQIAGLNSGTLVDQADVRQSTGALRIRRLYVSPAQHPRTGRNVCDCELPLSRMRRRHRARNKSARMLEMWQALATGLGTNTSSHSEQGKAIVADEVIDKR
jgi:hypothetical protein